MLRREIQTFPTFIYPHDPWRLVEKRLNPPRMAQMETLFALANGYMGIRGTFDEGTPVTRPGRSSIRSPPTVTRQPGKRSSTPRTAR
jgi:alpha,alpha-trehalose phosphorylase